MSSASLLRSVLSVAIASLALAVLAPGARAEPDGDPPPSSIRVSGEATVTSRPDRVEVAVGVVSRAPTSQEAATENARELKSVLASLRKTLGSKAKIQTISYSLHPDYQYPKDGGEPTITGYTATNAVQVTLDDLTALGTAIDAAVEAGANQIRSIRFTLQDEDEVQARALRAAALDARAKATKLAKALGLDVVGITSVVETSAPPRPMYDVAMARSEAVTTPIVAGTIETSATVTLTVAFAKRSSGRANGEGGRSSTSARARDRAP